MTPCTVVNFDPAIPIASLPPVVGDPTGDTITAGQFLYLGMRARLAGLTTGFAVEVQTAGGDWIRQEEWNQGGSQAVPIFGVDSTSDTITANQTVNIGSTSRFVALTNGCAIEVKDGDGNWIRQKEYTE